LTAALSIRRFLDALLHPSVHHDAIAAARHRIFIGLRLFGSFTVLASFPLYVALRGVPSVIEVFAQLADRADRHRLFSLTHRPL